MHCLPKQLPNKLNTMVNNVPLQAGINEHIFQRLKKMAATRLSENNVAVLSFDAMDITKDLHCNEEKDHFKGYQDHYHHGRENTIAYNALVFMVGSIRDKWKHPVAFYFHDKSMTSDRLSIIIQEVISKCLKTRLKIVATVCDMSPVTLEALESLGSSTESPYICIEGNEIVTIFDPPRLLKSTRTLLMKYDIECTTNAEAAGGNEKGVAKWSYIKTFNDLDKTNKNFVFAPALSDAHMNPNSTQKIDLKLAAQVFSHTVTVGLLAKMATGELPAEAHTTAMMLHKFDELFDCLNADSPDARRGKKCSTNMTKRSPHLSIFKNMKSYIGDLKFVGLPARPALQTGWIHTMNAVERLFENLKSLRVKSLPTRRLNLDPLENCFEGIRNNCGSKYPSITQFISGIETEIMSSLRRTEHDEF